MGYSEIWKFREVRSYETHELEAKKGLILKSCFWKDVKNWCKPRFRVFLRKSFFKFFGCCRRLKKKVKKIRSFGGTEETRISSQGTEKTRRLFLFRPIQAGPDFFRKIFGRPPKKNSAAETLPGATARARKRSATPVARPTPFARPTAADAVAILFLLLGSFSI